MTDEQLGQFKGQPWVVFDTIAARSFLVGENRPAFFAFNTPGPAINSRGEMVFFAAGRKKAQAPWYTNLDLDGQLAYGFRAWQMYLHLGLPLLPATTELQPSEGAFVPSGSSLNPSPLLVLAQLIVDFGVISLRLGQEEQQDFPVHQFGAGGGLYLSGAGAGNIGGQNSWPQDANVLKLPEPVEFPRTQNLDAILRLAPEVLPIIGSPTAGAEGVGNPLPDLTITCNEGDPPEPTVNNVPFPPFNIQLGMIGERIKKTQYGQVPDERR